MKHHNSILYDDLMHLSMDNINNRKYEIFLNFQNFKTYVAMQNGCYGDFASILEFRTYDANFGYTRELFKMIYLHLR